MRLGFAFHLGSILLLAAIAISAAIAFFGFLLSSGDEVNTAISGGVALAALLAVAAEQYIQPRSLVNAPIRVAQFEAAEVFLGKSLEFWDAFFRIREQSNANISAEEVSRAVESLAVTTEQLFGMLNRNLGTNERNGRVETRPSVVGQAGVAMSTARKY